MERTDERIEIDKYCHEDWTMVEKARFSALRWWYVANLKLLIGWKNVILIIVIYLSNTEWFRENTVETKDEEMHRSLKRSITSPSTTWKNENEEIHYIKKQY